MEKKSYKFEVEATHKDPPARYKDRHFRYIIENNSDIDSDVLVEEFCSKVVHPAVHTNKRLQGQPFIGRFEKIKERVYEYWVIEPNTD